MPTSKELRILSTLHKTLKLSKKERATYDKNWDEWLAWLRGEQKVKDKPSNRSNTVTNFIFSEVMTIIPILTSNVPGVSIRPEITFGDNADRWKDLSEEIARIVNRIFKRNEICERLTEAVTYGECFGKGYTKCTFDEEMYAGHGDVRIDAPDTRMIYMEPGKMRIRDANYIFETTRTDKLSLSRKYPDKFDEIQALFRKEIVAQGDSNKVSKQVAAAIEPTAPDAAASTDTVNFFEAMDDVDPKKHHTVELVEAWFHDAELEESLIEVFDADSAKPIMDKRTGKPKKQKVLRPRFPNGRIVQFSGRVLFDDRKNKFPGIPYFEYFNYFIPGEPGGMGDIAQAAPIQEQYNLRNNQLYDLLNYNLHPIRLYDKSSGLDESLISNAPNAWLNVLNVNGIRELTPHLPGVAAFESLVKIKQELETIFGVREVTQGTVAGDIRSGAAIEALQEAADVRLRRKSVALESMVKDMARFIINMISKFYVPGVHYDSRFASDDESVPGINNINGDMFEIEISAGVNRPRSRIAQQQERQWMLEHGIIDELGYIEASSLDQKEQIISRLKPIWDAKHRLLLEKAQGQPEDQGGGAAVQSIGGLG